MAIQKPLLHVEYGGGGTVEPRDVQKLLPWIKWAVEEIKLQFNE